MAELSSPMIQSLKQPARNMLASHRRRGRTTGFSVRIRTLADVDEKFRQAWLDLEAHSSIRNPFASSGYVLAAARNLPDVAPMLILTIEERGHLQGLGLFESVCSSRRLPVKHLRSWQTPHTYFDAPLLRSGSTERTVEEFWNYFLRGRHEWHGVEFPRFPNHDSVTEVFDGSAQAVDITCLKGTCWERASFSTEAMNSENALQHLSIKRAKSLRRGWRELEKRGPVRFEFQRDPNRVPDCAEELMQLENLGWKSKVGTSLASQAAHQQFFREMIAGLNQQGNVFFSRLLVGDQAVISVANLQAGDVAYAFKLGWNPAYERGCPGFQVKLQTASHAGEHLPGVRLIDSCSSPGSFIEHVWAHRRSFCTRTYVTSPVGNLAANMVHGLRWVRNNARAVSRHLFHPDLEQDQK